MNHAALQRSLSSALLLSVAWGALAAAPAVLEPADQPAPRNYPLVHPGDIVNPDFEKGHEANLAIARAGNVGLLFLGDSITAGWFWGDGDNSNRAIYDAHFGKYRPANFGIGYDKTQNVLWRIDNGELDGIHPRCVVLLIGTNNIGYPPAEIVAGVTAVVNTLHQKLPDTKVLLLGIFPRGADPKDHDTAENRDKIKTVNAALAKLDDGDRTRFLDIGSVFLEPDGSISKQIMTDYLHPSHEGFKRFANAIQPAVDAMMK